MKETTKKTTSETSWQIDSLVKNAFNRFKDRFLTYFLASVLGFFIQAAAYAVAGIIFGIGFMLFVFGLHMEALGIGLGVLLGIAFIGVIYYLSSWVSLATLNIIIADKKPSISESYKEMKPLVPGYMWLMVLLCLFLLGLFIWGILSVFIIYILWSIWGIFTAMIYIKHQQKGLHSAWMSKQMVSSRFWAILGRMAVLWICTVGFYYLLSLLGKSGVNSAISLITSLFITPFTYCYVYEMYTQLQKPTEVKPAKGWIILSGIGWVLLLALIVTMSASAGTLFNNMMKDNKMNPQQNKYQHFSKGDDPDSSLHEAAFKFEDWYEKYTTGGHNGNNL